MERSKVFALRNVSILLLIVIVLLIGIQMVPGWSSQTLFLSTSLLLVAYAFVNYLNVVIDTDATWKKYLVLLLLAMIFGSIGDFAMPGLFLFPTDTPLLNGILYFGIGHVFYIFALKDISPLLQYDIQKSQIVTRNLVLWLFFVIFVVSAFLLTVYNPSEQVLSIGALGYGILLISAAAFAFAKWFEDYPSSFKLSLALGFVFFFISDWVIAIRNFRDPSLLSGTSFVGVTYLIGQLLIQSALLLGYWITSNRNE